MHREYAERLVEARRQAFPELHVAAVELSAGDQVAGIITVGAAFGPGGEHEHERWAVCAYDDAGRVVEIATSERQFAKDYQNAMDVIAARKRHGP